MIHIIKKHSTYIFLYIWTFFRWLCFSAVTGMICGLIGILFHYAIHYASQARIDCQMISIFMLPAAGLLIVKAYKLFHMGNDTGTNMIISSIRSDERVPLVMAPLIFFGTFLTHLCGGSSGREGAALQIGGSIGSALGRFFHLDEKDLHILTMCGMSAVFSALFGTPLTAAIFSMEVISVGIIYYTAFIPCLISGLIAFFMALKVNIPPTGFRLPALPDADIPNSLKVMLLSALCAAVSILFCITMHKTGAFFKKRMPNQYIRIAAGAALVVIMTLLVGETTYNGTGMDTIQSALAGNKIFSGSFLLKIVFTAITLGSGFKGGEIVPTFFIGATFGSAFGSLLGIDPAFGAAIGLIALFCGVVNCPIASILLSVELFGSDRILLFAVACAVSYTLSGYYSLYNSQKIMYSKLHPKYINKDAH